VAPKNNIKYWLTIYSIEEIKRAIDFISVNDFWADKMDLTILFRKKNPKGEETDHIGKLLNSSKPKQQDKEGSNIYLNRLEKWKKLRQQYDKT
jgi:hypothetical protein